MINLLWVTFIISTKFACQFISLSFKYLEDLRREGGRRMKAKRIRTIFTPEQLERMEDEFNK